MNWKKFKEHPKKQDEAFYIIGLDIGNDSSAIAFYNMAEGAPESIDLSGGYGKPSIPTVLRYMPDTKEWIFGEYAILNSDVGTVYKDLLKKLGNNDYVDVGTRSVSVASVFALFIKELLSNIKNINPKAEIVGIVASIPAYFSAAAREELTRVFKLAGYEKELIALVPDRECVLAHYYHTPPKKTEYALLIDLGSRELRGGLYSITEKDGSISAVSLSSVFDNTVSLNALNSDVQDLFASFLTSGDSNAQLSAFTYQHKDILFQKNIRAKPQKLYYNFVYPPEQHTLTNDRVIALVEPYNRQFNKFLSDVLQKNLYKLEISPNDVNTVLCVGGGFDMLWAKEAVSAVFPKERIHFYKNPKLTIAEGAALIAARELDVAGSPLLLEDKHQLTNDIGIADGDNFLTIVERNGFWWQQHAPKLVLVNAEVGGDFPITLAELSEDGIKHILAVTLDDLPKRPKGVTRLQIGISFRSNTELTINVSDLGFGELFPKTDYMREFAVRREES